MDTGQNHIIETPRLTLISCTEPILNAALESDDKLERILQVKVIPNWSIFGPGALHYVLQKLKENPKDVHWWTYLPILKENNTLIGSGGFKGQPDQEGRVEIGYEIAGPYQRKGLATEMAKGLLNYAIDQCSVKKVMAHTLGKPNASTSVLTKCGFHKIGELTDPEEGTIWRWETNQKVKY